MDTLPGGSVCSSESDVSDVGEGEGECVYGVVRERKDGKRRGGNRVEVWAWREEKRRSIGIEK